MKKKDNYGYGPEALNVTKPNKAQSVQELEIKALTEAYVRALATYGQDVIIAVRDPKTDRQSNAAAGNPLDLLAMLARLTDRLIEAAEQARKH